MRLWLPILLGLVLPTTALCADRFDKSRFLRTLGGRNEESKLRVLHRLQTEFRDRPESGEVLIEATRTLRQKLEERQKRPIPASAFRIVRALGECRTAAAEEAFLALFDSPRRDIVIAACLAVQASRLDGALESLKKLVDQPNYETHHGFRHATLKAIATIESPKSIQFLEELFPRLTGRLRYEVWNYLHDEDVQRVRRDDDRPMDGFRNQLTRYQRYSSQSNSSFSQYYGVPIYADRLVFVFDRSGSMRRVVNGRTRLARAKEELIQAIRGLPEQTSFNIVAYATDVRTWQSRLVSATAKNRKKAIRYVARMQANNATSTYSALMMALTLDDNTESIFLLSDGAPTKGRIVYPPAIVEAISTANALRACTINTVGLAITGSTADFMNALATHNHGVYRPVH